MGNKIDKSSKTGPEKIIIQGLWGSGKTSLLYSLKHGEAQGEPMMSFGTNIESIDIAGMSVACWDLGGREKSRPIARLSYTHATGFVYVIDSADRNMLDEALDDLISYVLLDDMAKGTVVMVLANKQDLPGAMTAEEVEEALKKKYKFSKHSSLKHTVFVRPCSATNMDGVLEAFGELAQQLRLKRAGLARLGLLRTGGELVEESTIKAETKTVDDIKLKLLFKDPLSFCKSLFH